MKNSNKNQMAAITIALLMASGSSLRAQSESTREATGDVARPQTSSPTDFVDTLNSTFGKQTTNRATHAKGVVVSGKFTPRESAQSLSTAAHFQHSVPVTCRFSDNTGIPTLPDADDHATPHGMALKFHLPDGSETNLVTHSFNGFPAATGDEMRQFFIAVGSSGPGVSPPTPLDKFLAAHPAAQKFVTTQEPPLAELGATVVIGARRKDRLDAIVKDITAKGGKALAVTVDVTKREQVDALIQAALKAYGKVDVLVNNAGIMPIAPLAALKVDEWEKMIDINIKGVLYGIAAALPVFTKAKSGHFINLSSVAGIKVFAPGGSVYSGTKFAVHAISEGLRMETRKDNIRVTILSPGAVDSELKEGSSDAAGSQNVKEFYKIAIPADSIAHAIAYAIEQPSDVEIDEIVVRPTVQEF